MDDAKIILTKKKEVVMVEGENVSPVEQVVMCHAMIMETANKVGLSFNELVAVMLNLNEKWEKDQEEEILS